MPSFQSGVCRREQLFAMRDASAGAFEVAKIKYFRLLKHVESVSLEYVCGKRDMLQVRAVVEKLLEAKFFVAETARRTRLYQEELDTLLKRDALTFSNQSSIDQQKNAPLHTININGSL